jgi:hypothetical protein
MVSEAQLPSIVATGFSLVGRRPHKFFRPGGPQAFSATSAFGCCIDSLHRAPDIAY